ncbi:TRAPPC-Trs85 domain containing protein [Pyrenophora tritici-repentis]|uniref:Uncharacterized protein n=1 Tax=Pyrenophora tritici-repentis TaxID=45151 RepID=A0A2W1DYV8_9PLEO|nr:TRAPPC-Trs85 multi-domain protein [Pyrenophora tritici-repentis]KAF7579516.1 hypothetical protein PtrM4_037560 [Pyrenophora tritici-repentis]KAI1539574.1 TRAPPC-Trs85 domain containing protein [Pyrenophora tritici-repentis]KAI1544295.1 TRAPPC-Trs85 domain containing protein [Pyrenophora tritici-repentis]KAI1570359.1 TRAPPC-Trs85 domain containing protein [Pyrenophora tritici-repentis]
MFNPRVEQFERRIQRPFSLYGFFLLEPILRGENSPERGFATAGAEFVMAGARADGVAGRDALGDEGVAGGAHEVGI